MPTLPPSSSARRASRRFRAMHARACMQPARASCTAQLGSRTVAEARDGKRQALSACPRWRKPERTRRHGEAERTPESRGAVLRPGMPAPRALLTACMHANSLVTRGRRGRQSHGRREKGERCLRPCAQARQIRVAPDPRVMARTATTFDSHVAVVDSCETRNRNTSASASKSLQGQV